MKRMMLVLAVVMSAQLAFADEIFLTDGTVLKGAVIQITEKNVEYDPEGPAAFDSVARDRVTRVVYDGGREVRMVADTIEFTSGETIRAAVRKVTADSITYVREGATEESTVPRGDVARIVFGDGRTFELSDRQEERKEEIEEKPVEPVPGYHKSIFRLCVFGGGGALTGGIADKERRVFRAYRPDLMLANVLPWNYDMFSGFGTGGVEADFMPPAIGFAQKRGFDFSGIKFGVRARYGYEHAVSTINSSDYDDMRTDILDSFLYGRMLGYHYWSAGPTISFIFSPRSNILSMLLSMYVMGGQVFEGRLSPMSALRDSKLLTLRLSGMNNIWGMPAAGPPWNGSFMGWANLLTLSGNNKTRVRGYTIRAGLGPEFTLNRHFPLIVGLRLTYAYTRLSFGKPPWIYLDGDTNAAHHEVGAEVSLGIHL